MIKPNSFDTLRLFGSLIVMIGHAFIITDAFAPHVGSIPIHTFGVCIFFTISGFLIAKSWSSDPHWLRFLQRRALRIFPALFIVTLVTATIIGSFATTEPLSVYFHHGWTWRYILSNSALVTVWGLPGVFDTLPIPGQANGSLWTLPIEFGLYLVTPLIVFIGGIGRRLGSLMLVLCAVILVALSLIFPDSFVYNFHGINVGRGLVLAPYFWLGAAFQMLDFGNAGTRMRLRCGVVSFGLTILWIATMWSALFPFVVIAITLMVLTIGLADFFYSAVLTRLGDLSYGTYLWAFPLQQLVMLKLGGGVIFNLAIAGPPTLLLAFISWHFIEKPSLRFKPRRTENRVVTPDDDATGRQVAISRHPLPRQR